MPTNDARTTASPGPIWPRVNSTIAITTPTMGSRSPAMTPQTGRFDAGCSVGRCSVVVGLLMVSHPVIACVGMDARIAEI